MGYLNNASITVEAILTKKGRQILSQGRQFFNITKFALSDDEIDYHLWNSAHPSGSNYYGIAIEQMPVLEPIPDETQSMRYKLVSLDKSTVRIPVISVGQTAIQLVAGTTAVVQPSTIQYGTGNAGAVSGLNSQLGYTAILHNSDAAYLYVTQNIVEGRIVGAYPVTSDKVVTIDTAATAGASIFLGDSDAARSVYAVGRTFKLVGKDVGEQFSINTTLTLIGNETGGSVSISITTGL